MILLEMIILWVHNFDVTYHMIVENAFLLLVIKNLLSVCF